MRVADSHLINLSNLFNPGSGSDNPKVGISFYKSADTVLSVDISEPGFLGLMDFRDAGCRQSSNKSF